MELTQTRYEIEKGVATVTLYRPDKLNALTHTMRKELVAIFAAADQDDSVRAVVVKGAGKAFCAGAEGFSKKRPPKFAMKVSSDMPDFYPWWKEPKV